jgi:magnesium transporter
MPDSFFKKRLKTIGLPPGSLIYTGERQVEKAGISLIRYDEASFDEVSLERVDECRAFLEKGGVSWINVDGLNDIAIIERVGELFDIHPLLLEDVLSVDQRPKIEQQGSNLLITLKMLTYDHAQHSVIGEHVSILLGGHYVITFQERQGDVFESVRERIRQKLGRICRMKNDFLAYALIDAVVDNYFITLDGISESAEDVEEEMREQPDSETSHNISRLKRELLLVRKSIWPLREILHALSRGEYTPIEKSTEAFIRDVYDHTVQIIESVETLRDIVSGMLDTYLSTISFQMNKTMSVLTIIATIFIPLTFIAGIYGMNFRHMPELEWRIGYPLVLGSMAAIAAFMLLLFKRKKWL